jgi:hypothetical protein
MHKTSLGLVTLSLGSLMMIACGSNPGLSTGGQTGGGKGSTGGIGAGGAASGGDFGGRAGGGGGSPGSGGGVAGAGASGGNRGNGGTEVGTGGMSGGSSGTGGCIPPPCALLECPYGYQSSATPCGCGTCAPPPESPDGATAKDAGNGDGPTTCPETVCSLPNCRYGIQPSPEACGCPTCAPNPDAGMVTDAGGRGAGGVGGTGGTGGNHGGSGGGSGGGAGGNSGGTRVTGDAGPSCSMSASEYDNSCSVDSDCVAVPEGAPCDNNCLSVCPTSALNVRVASQYLADMKALMAEHNESPVCACPCYGGPYCCRGTCTSACSGCNPTD